MFPLRPFQREALETLQYPGHLLCIAPTGAGKSRIYEELAAKNGQRLLLITPLVALARQQARKLRELNIPVSLSSGGNPDPTPSSKSGAWILSPESLQNPHRRMALKNWNPTLLVVDECHCLWEWGDGFRPAFQQIPDLIDENKIERSLWLTATLPPEAHKELRDRLPLKIQGQFGMPKNLSLGFQRVPWIERAQVLLNKLLELTGPGIIFTGTRDGTLRLQRLVQFSGRTSTIYHAGLSREERTFIEASLQKGIPEIVIATSAFGMGMDLPHFRWVILWQAPTSILSLAQAIGRAGRGAYSSQAWIFWDDEDFRLLEWTLQNSERKKSQLHALAKLLGSERCRTTALESYFHPEAPYKPCKRCDWCSENLQNYDANIM